MGTVYYTVHHSVGQSGIWLCGSQYVGIPFTSFRTKCTWMFRASFANLRKLYCVAAATSSDPSYP